MGSKSCSFAIGLGLGSVVGALAYRYSRTSAARRWKRKADEAYRKFSGRAGELMDAAKEKALEARTKVADKVAVAAGDVAGKVGEVKSKAQDYAAAEK